MATEYILGRSSDSPVKIAPDKNAVSSHHAKITITDDGVWTLEDLRSANGTYVRDANGVFQRVFKKQITETDVIRLGAGGIASVIFTARRVTDPDASYAFEFRQLKLMKKDQLERETQMEKRIERNGWISKCAGLGAIGLCAILGSFEGVNIDPNVRYVLIALAPVIAGLCFAGDTKALKVLRARRSKILVCPRCQRPLSEYDIEQGACSSCKAR